MKHKKRKSKSKKYDTFEEPEEGGAAVAVEKHALKHLQKRMKAVMKEKGNKVCSECRSKKPKWMSLLQAPIDQERRALGVLCCSDCQAYHAALGEELCILKSLKVPEDWTEEDVVTLEKSGNQVVNAIYQSALEGKHTDKHIGQLASQAFVESKYKHCHYFSEDTFHEQMELRAKLVEEAQKRKQKQREKEKEQEEPPPPTTDDLVKQALKRQTKLKGKPVPVEDQDAIHELHEEGTERSVLEAMFSKEVVAKVLGKEEPTTESLRRRLPSRSLSNENMPRSRELSPKQRRPSAQRRSSLATGRMGSRRVVTAKEGRQSTVRRSMSHDAPPLSRKSTIRRTMSHDGVPTRIGPNRPNRKPSHLGGGGGSRHQRTIPIEGSRHQRTIPVNSDRPRHQRSIHSSSHHPQRQPGLQRASTVGGSTNRRQLLRSRSNSGDLSDMRGKLSHHGDAPHRRASRKPHDMLDHSDLSHSLRRSTRNMDNSSSSGLQHSQRRSSRNLDNSSGLQHSRRRSSRNLDNSSSNVPQHSQRRSSKNLDNSNSDVPQHSWRRSAPRKSHSADLSSGHQRRTATTKHGGGGGNHHRASNREKKSDKSTREAKGTKKDQLLEDHDVDESIHSFASPSHGTDDTDSTGSDVEIESINSSSNSSSDPSSTSIAASDSSDDDDDDSVSSADSSSANQKGKDAKPQDDELKTSSHHRRRLQVSEAITKANH